MNPEGTQLLDNGVMLFDGHDAHPTVEGPKFYKRNGYYFIFAPAGGVATGWQLVLRSKDIYGPYTGKIVMAQGKSIINGPHQGAWIDTQTGEDWFLHFQDKGAYGRIVHLQPMKWLNDWPIIGSDNDNDGTGEPVLVYKKPNVGKVYEKTSPPESDEFDNHLLGMQWQWHANPELTWGFPTGNLGFFRLNCIPKSKDYKNLWDTPNLLMQKLPAEEFTATVKLTFNARFDGEEAGLLIMGQNYQSISLKRDNGKLNVSVVRCIGAEKGKEPEEIFTEPINGSTVYLRVKVEKGANCSFLYSIDGKKYFSAGDKFVAKEGKWIGAKVGLYALREGVINDAGNADIDWFRLEK